MKRIFLFLLAAVVSFSVHAADDVADAKVAFDTLQTYQKTDDLRALDLFATNCVIRFRTISALEDKTMFIQPAAFRDLLKAGIAKKEGSQEKYDDVKFSADGFAVKVTATVLHPGDIKPGEFMISYERDGDGALKIQELKVTTYIAKPADQPAAAK